MTTGFRLYRGLEIYPLVYPHRVAAPGAGHNYEDGFDAAVRIQEPATMAAARSKVFRVEVRRPFESAGDARRASMAYAEQLIDTWPSDARLLDSDEAAPPSVAEPVLMSER